jgi:amino acid adenylation domain-containing protein
MESYSPDKNPGLMRPLTKPQFKREHAQASGISEARGLHLLFAAEAQRVPDAVAVIFEGKQLTYRELDQRSNQLAHYLMQRGVGPEVIVGLCLERTIEMVVAVMGILKAGGAYLPLDVSYPAERLGFVLRDARVTRLLTESRLLERLLASTLAVTCLDREAIEISRCLDTAPKNRVAPDNLAYVIYTSGSTGRPKGVMVTHGGLVNYLQWCVSAYDVAQGGGSLVHSPIGFDLTVTSLFAPLVCGSHVTLVPEDVGVESLSAALKRQEGLSLLKITPSHLESLGYLLEDSDTAAGARSLIVGGEALRAEHLAFWRRAAPHARIFNEYGPTETVVGCCVFEVPPGELEPGAVPIGWPIANTQLYILDPKLQPVTSPESGELYIGGAGVARGYLNEARLTAEKFVPNPFAERPGERLYRSGDKVRYLSDGSIEFLGRMDDQVKIMGYRIEPGEIESILLQHPAIKEGVVVARQGNAGDMSLTAYLVWQPQPTKSIGDVRDFLRKQIPEYMIPAAFVVLDALPLNQNGKVDRAALPSPEVIRPELSESYAPARTDGEKQLMQIWETVLGIGNIGIRDNFFELGGNSILAARLFAHIAESFGRKLPLSTLFQARTIELLAGVLDEGLPVSERSLVPLQPRGAKPPLYCLHACGPHTFLYLPLARHLGEDQPVYGLQARGINHGEEPFTRVSDMAAHYVKEIREFQPRGPYHLLGDTLGGLFAFEVANLLREQGEEVALLAMVDTHCPLPPSLWRRLSYQRVSLKEKGLGPYLTETVVAAGHQFDARLWKIVRNKEHGIGKLLSPRMRSAGRAAKQIIVRTTRRWIPRQDEPEVQTEALPDDPITRTELAIAVAVLDEYAPPKKAFRGKITYFLASESSYQLKYKDNRLDWRKLAADGFEVHVIPAGHDTIREEPHVAILARKLTSCLERAGQVAEKAALSLFLTWVSANTISSQVLGVLGAFE